jgi:hydrogenase nickel incorporation protein HypB
MKIKVATKILEANDRIALENRKLFDKERVFVINLMSAPGAGKTSLLERTLSEETGLRFGVIEGDIAGSDDAERIDVFGVPVVQINTQGACHLDANMIYEVIHDMPMHELDIVIIENVGNLVCPAEFNIGEDIKVMLLSITEGHDKPLKYPLMFQESAALVLNKIDLVPHTDVDLGKIKKDSLSLNPRLRIFDVSCRTGEGISDWIEWLKSRAHKT